MNSTPKEWPRRRVLSVFLGFGMGVLLLALAFTRPTIANMRTTDLVQLLATGALLGVGLEALILYLFGRRED